MNTVVGHTKAWLEGHQYDLQDLSRLLGTGDVQVLHDAQSDAYYLTAAEIDNPPNGQAYSEVAQRIIRRVNGLGRTSQSDFRPVKLTGRYTTPTGESVVAAAVALEVRLRISVDAVVIGADGRPRPDPPSPWPSRLDLVTAHPDVAEALDILGSTEPLGWVDLYKVHEIIRGSIKPRKIVDLGWADKNTDSAFTGSANLPGVSGADARHARMDGQPAHTMTLAEGRSYVSRLVANWLDLLNGAS